MTKALAALALILPLAACGPEPAPQLEATNLVMLERSRDVLMKGTRSTTENVPPAVYRFTYKIACVADDQGGTPDQRADRLIAAAPRAAGQVYVPIGFGYLRSFELRKLNTVAVPQTRCEVRDMTATPVASGQAAFAAAALRLNAVQEMMGR
ncbi:hypothetical protein SAMN04488021_12218 [Paracoccus aminovorans]|uniref:Lipoprotein n=1 Tax=Paracoccus aminovorans TaxID=34004 RepID=A0A1I3BHZ8_9RHOB|nr:hypothetical protein [Paracoccus aminovorans]CQR87098.1 hypothetical protein JCM7685_2553 [Paracoccus aminovorans]SFH61917.1 hypothetical protein SAMN04488021_12218 [Paracoccus aminovorans]